MEIHEITVLLRGVYAVASIGYCLFGRPIPLSVGGAPVSDWAQRWLRLFAAFGMVWLSMMVERSDRHA